MGWRAWLGGSRRWSRGAGLRRIRRAGRQGGTGWCHRLRDQGWLLGGRRCRGRPFVAVLGFANGQDRLGRRRGHGWLGCRAGAGAAAGFDQTADAGGFVIADRTAVALGGNRQLFGGFEHVAVVQAQVPGQLINSDFAAAGHSGLQLVGATGASEPERGDSTPQGHCLSCLSVSDEFVVQTLFKRCVDGIGNRAAQGPLQPFSSPGLLKALQALAEIGRTAHALIQCEASRCQSDDPPELPTIEQLPAGHTAAQDGTAAHRTSSSSETSSPPASRAASPGASSALAAALSGASSPAVASPPASGSSP